MATDTTGTTTATAMVPPGDNPEPPPPPALAAVVVDDEPPVVADATPAVVVGPVGPDVSVEVMVRVSGPEVPDEDVVTISEVVTTERGGSEELLVGGSEVLEVVEVEVVVGGREVVVWEVDDDVEDVDEVVGSGGVGVLFVDVVGAWVVVGAPGAVVSVAAPVVVVVSAGGGTGAAAQKNVVRCLTTLGGTGQKGARGY